MTLKESVSIIRQIDRFYPSFNPSPETVKAWSAELFEYFEEHDAKWVWQQLHTAIIKDGGTFTPSLPWVVDKIYLGVRDKNLGIKYNTRQLKEPEEQVPEDVFQKNMAKIKAVLKAAEEKAAANKEEREISYRDMAEQRTFGRVLTDEERELRRKERVEINLDPEKESKLLDLYIQHVGHDGAAQPGKMLKRKRGKR